MCYFAGKKDAKPGPWERMKQKVSMAEKRKNKVPNFKIPQELSNKETSEERKKRRAGRSQAYLGGLVKKLTLAVSWLENVF